MLALKHRFHGHNSLRPLYQKGSSIYSRNLKLLWQPAKPDSYKVAIVVSKKIHKSAVVRNRIRRRLYEATRRFYAQEQLGCDLVYVVQNASLATLPAADVQAEVDSLLKKLPKSH